jgi:hypothetical protein
VPRVAEPPTTPFTAQVTAVFELPETVAVNGKESPARILAVEGATVIVVVPGAEGVEGVEGLLFEVVVALHPPSNRIARSGSGWIVERMGLEAHRPF